MNGLRRRVVLLMGILAAITALLGCSESIDHDALESDLRSRLEQIQGAEVTKVEWARSGLGEDVRAELRLEGDDPALGEPVAMSALDAIAETAVAADYSRNATIELRVYGTDGALLVKNEDIGPSTLGRLLEGR